MTPAYPTGARLHTRDGRTITNAVVECARDPDDPTSQTMIRTDLGEGLLADDAILAALFHEPTEIVDPAGLAGLRLRQHNTLANLSGAVAATLHALRQAGGYTAPAGHEARIHQAFTALEHALADALNCTAGQCAPPPNWRLICT